MDCGVFHFGWCITSFCRLVSENDIACFECCGEGEGFFSLFFFSGETFGFETGEVFFAGCDFFVEGYEGAVGGIEGQPFGRCVEGFGEFVEG